MSTPPAFIAAKRSLSKRRVVSGVHWQQITTKSLSGKSAAKLAESRWQGPVWVRVAAGADDPHAEGGAEFTDIEPDSTDVCCSPCILPDNNHRARRNAARFHPLTHRETVLAR